MRFVRADRRLRAALPRGPERYLPTVFRQGLDALAKALAGTAGLAGPPELFVALLVFDELWRSGRGAGPPAVAAYLIRRHGWSGPDARKAAFTWQVVAGLRSLDGVRTKGIETDGSQCEE